MRLYNIEAVVIKLFFFPFHLFGVTAQGVEELEEAGELDAVDEEVEDVEELVDVEVGELVDVEVEEEELVDDEVGDVVDVDEDVLLEKGVDEVLLQSS